MKKKFEKEVVRPTTKSKDKTTDIISKLLILRLQKKSDLLIILNHPMLMDYASKADFHEYLQSLKSNSASYFKDAIDKVMYDRSSYNKIHDAFLARVS